MWVPLHNSTHICFFRASFESVNADILNSSPLAVSVRRHPEGQALGS